jgi:hypothetical protein
LAHHNNPLLQTRPTTAGFFVSPMDILDNAYISTHFESHGTDHNAEMLAAYEFGVAKTIFTKLWEHYAGYDWKVAVDAIGGYAAIKLPRLHHSTLGYNILLSDLASDPDLRHVVRGGGELLERFKLTRGRVSKPEYTDKIKNRPAVFRKTDYIDGGLAIDNVAKWVHGQNRIVVQ